MLWHLSRKPWEVQIEAARRSTDHTKYGYFIEMGLGKTALALNDAARFKGLDGMVVLTPNSFKSDWVMAPAEWGLEIETMMWPYTKPRIITDDFFLYAVNYEAARAGAFDDFIRLLESRRCLLVIDESSAIKNPRAQTTKAVIELSKRATMVRELNGTPMTQNVMDYWGQLRAIGQLNGMNPFQFRNKYAVLGGYMGRQIKGIQNEDELYALLDRCSFRALKKDWRKDLPPKLYVPVHLEMTARQKKHYSEMMEDFYTEINGMEVAADIVLTRMDKLRQISSCLLMSEGKSEFIEDPNKNPKLRAVLDVIEGGPTKVIVVYFYKASGLMLYDALKKEGLQPAVIRGQMTQDDLVSEKRRFNEDPECRVLVAQESAAHLGHTLLGGNGTDRVTRMVFFENSFGLKERLQMEDRIHRGSQDQDCVYYDLITSPMDQIGVNILTRKKSAADAIDAVVAAVKKREW